MCNRESFFSYIPHIKNFSLTSDTQNIIRTLTAYYNFDESCSMVDTSVFKQFFKTIFKPKASTDDIELFDLYMDNVDKSVAIPTDAGALLEHFIKLAGVSEVYDMINKMLDGDTTITIANLHTKVGEVQDKLEDTMETEEDFLSNSLDDITTYTSMSTGLAWGIPALDAGVGPLRPSNFVVVAARPEVGKTAFIISITGHHAIQLPNEPNRVLVFNNEEDGKSIQARFRSRVLQRSWTDITGMPTGKVEADYVAKVGHKDIIQVIDKDTLYTGYIESVLKKTRPAVVVINQMDKVQGIQGYSNDADRLTKLYNWGRRMAKKYQLVFIAVTQADASAEGEKWLHQGQMDGSKTGKPAEADLIIMIGKDPAFPNDRFLNVPKNKLPGGPGVSERLRHGHHEVKFNGVTSTYT